MSEIVCLLAAAGQQEAASPVGGLLVLGGVAWALYAIFKPKKAKYVVEQETRARRIN